MMFGPCVGTLTYCTSRFEYYYYGVISKRRVWVSCFFHGTSDDVGSSSIQLDGITSTKEREKEKVGNRAPVVQQFVCTDPLLYVQSSTVQDAFVFVRTIVLYHTYVRILLTTGTVRLRRL